MFERVNPYCAPSYLLKTEYICAIVCDFIKAYRFLLGLGFVFICVWLPIDSLLRDTFIP